MTDNESQYINLQKKAFRAITYDYDILSTYGDNARLYCLTDFQAGWLLSNADYMRWQTRWTDCPCTQSELDAMKAELEYNLMNCLDFDPYQMTFVYEQNVNDKLDQLQLAYDVDGIAGLNPETPTDFYDGDGSTERLDALCMACEGYVTSYLNNWLRTARTLLGLTFLLGLAIVVNPLVGIIACLVVGGLAFVSQVAIDAVSDPVAVENIICCMYNSLIGDDVTQANFITCLDGCFFDVGSNEAIIRDIIASDLSIEKNWLAFLEQLGKSMSLMLAGVVYDCPCTVTPTFNHFFDFTIDQQGFAIFNDGLVSGSRGTYVGATGFVAANNRSGAYRRSADIRISFTTRTITRMILTYDLTKGSYNAVENGLEVRASGVGGTLLNNSPSFVNGNGQDFDTGVFSNPSTQLQVGIVTSRQSTASYSGSALLLSLYVEGIGSDPF